MGGLSEAMPMPTGRLPWIKFLGILRRPVQMLVMPIPLIASTVMTDKTFLDWIRKQPSCLSGKFSEYLESGEGRCVAAHHREVADGAGTAIKPPYSAYPLTFEEHALTHQHGLSYFRPIEWWREKRDYYRETWLNNRFETLF